VLYILSWPLTTFVLVGWHCLSPRFPYLPLALPEMSVKKRQAALLCWRHSWITPMKGVSGSFLVSGARGRGGAGFLLEFGGQQP